MDIISEWLLHRKVPHLMIPSGNGILKAEFFTSKNTRGA